MVTVGVPVSSAPAVVASVPAPLELQRAAAIGPAPAWLEGAYEPGDPDNEGLLRYATYLRGDQLGVVELRHDPEERLALWEWFYPLGERAHAGSSRGLGTLCETLILEDLADRFGTDLSVGQSGIVTNPRARQLERLGESLHEDVPLLDAIAHRRDYLAGKGYDPDARPFRSSIGRYLSEAKAR